MVTAKTESQFARRLGRALAIQRSDKKMTQEEVAERIGVEQETISRFERGATIPPLLRLIDLAELFSVPLEVFVRAGSARALDQSIDIVAAMDQLNDDDREWVRRWAIETCQKLSVRSSVVAKRKLTGNKI